MLTVRGGGQPAARLRIEDPIMGGLRDWQSGEFLSNLSYERGERGLGLGEGGERGCEVLGEGNFDSGGRCVK